MSRYALLSVSDKTGIVDFAAGLTECGYKIISTGGTATTLKQAGVDVIEIAEFTGFPEILDGRVKTLHPMVHGGILNIRTNEAHCKTVAEHNIKNIDIVAVNLYPFEQTVLKDGSTYEEIIENIDIGGPSMVRSAAKNHAFVTVVVNCTDYDSVLNELREQGEISLETRKLFAAKAFSHTALYDSCISNYMNNQLDIKFPYEYTIGGRLIQKMRYGENPHQDAAFYRTPLSSESGATNAIQLHGKELSFNNIVDIQAALELVKEFSEPAAVIVKHTNPCGVAISDDIFTAYTTALECDPVSAFGGIVALNRDVDDKLATKLAELFLEVIIAPEFSKKALDILTTKKNIRLMVLSDKKYFLHTQHDMDVKKVTGGFLLQDADSHSFDNLLNLRCPTKRKPTDDERQDMMFAWIVAKHVKSNAIVYAKNGRTIGVGAGQMSRVDSSKIAVSKAQSPLEGCVMASDAFFPFRDSVDEAAKNGVTAIVSPGGSVRDQEVIDAADEAGIAMIFTEIRHFKH